MIKRFEEFKPITIIDMTIIYDKIVLIAEYTDIPNRTAMSDNDISYLIKKLSKYPLLSKEEEQELLKKAKEGDKQAIDKIITSNLRFVVKVAKNYKGKGIPFQDLVSAGSLGLLEAIKRFDPDKNVRFLSYAVWWIIQAIQDLFKNEIGLPYNTVHLVRKIDNIYLRLKESLGREPSYQELLQELEREKISIDKDKLIYLLFINKYSISLNSYIDSNNKKEFIDVYYKYDTEDIEKEIFQEELKKQIDDLLEKLPDKEKTVIIHRFGLKNEEPKTLEEISNIIKLSKERVRQIEKEALKRIRGILLKEKKKEN